MNLAKVSGPLQTATTTATTTATKTFCVLTNSRLEAKKAATDAGKTDLEAMVDVWASQPLLFEPGTHWLYSRATDVVGRLVEVVSGQSLDAFFAEHILGPIGMTDTAFSVPDDKTDRLASLYVPDPDTHRAVAPPDVRSQEIGDFFSGGGGLFGTAGVAQPAPARPCGRPRHPATTGAHAQPDVGPAVCA